MTASEGLLYINIVACIVAIVIRTGLNIEGTGWLETFMKSIVARLRNKSNDIGNENT